MHIVLLPGVGADKRLFDALGRSMPGVVVPSWLAPKRCEGLAAYAARWAAEGTWPSPLVLGGSSFGGMVAVELGRHLRPAALALIGSCLHPSELAQPLRALRLLARRISLPTLPHSAPIMRMLAWYFGATSPATRQLFRQMLRDTDPAFLTWAVRAIASWNPTPPSTTRVRRIHGRDDRLISCPVSADVAVDGAGHLLPITHPEVVASFLASVAAVARPIAGA